ncbi:MAG TPA: hypothetical protein VMA36_02595 [Candidatus Limnocylindria bacterium]|jgi:hypothetical protein|nr:hypothetical protein [Candidatus Limnocylindria bacterium]
MRSSLLATTVLVLGLGATTCAAAQSSAPPAPVPTPIAVPTLPPNTPGAQIIQRAIDLGVQILQRNAANARNDARGQVTYFKRYDMQVLVGPNAYRNVRLRPGTVINPRGGTPAAGTVVDVNGRTDADGTLEADTITIQR